MTDLLNALDKFLSAVGVPVYPENGVPVDAVLPYMTYTPVQTPWDSDALMSVRIWDRSTNYARLAEYAEHLRRILGESVTLKTDSGGYIYLYPGDPWAQVQPMQDSNVRVLYINIGINTMIP